MTKNVRIKESPTIIWDGGKLDVPKAFRTRDKTITNLIKQVVIIKILGARERTVNRMRIWTPFVNSWGVLAPLKPMLKFGIAIWENAWFTPKKKTTIKDIKNLSFKLLIKFKAPHKNKLFYPIKLYFYQ